MNEGVESNPRAAICDKSLTPATQGCDGKGFSWIKLKNKGSIKQFIWIVFVMFFVSNAICIPKVNGFTGSINYNRVNTNMNTMSFNCKSSLVRPIRTRRKQIISLIQSIRLRKQSVLSSLHSFSMKHIITPPSRIMPSFTGQSSLYLSSLDTYSFTNQSFATLHNYSPTHHFVPTISNKNNYLHLQQLSSTPVSITEQLFSFQLPEGRCVGLTVNTDNQLTTEALSLLQQQYHHHSDSNGNNDLSLLHPEEIAHAKTLPYDGSERSSRIAFIAGRLAMRSALRLVASKENDQTPTLSLNQELDVIKDNSILKDNHGRPIMPHGYLGSISHKLNRGVALVDVDSSCCNTWASHRTNTCDAAYIPKKGIGVDIERTFSKRVNIARRVLTTNEIENLGNVKGVNKDEEVLLIFSLKESIYKAMHPLICQHVGFQEAEVTPHSNGTATVWFNLKSGAHESFDHEKTTAHWQRLEGDFFVTSASVTTKKE